MYLAVVYLLVVGTRHGAFSSAPPEQDCSWLCKPRLFNDEHAVARSYSTKRELFNDERARAHSCSTSR
jgi:hypothetical protein